MSAVLPIYSTQAAPAPMAGWLQRVLQPVLEACRFERGLPVEVRPTGAWSGWCASPNEAPDRRIALSKKICFWSAENIVSVYLHESAHRFLEAREIAAHGPEFFCLNAILLLRSASCFRLNPLSKLDFFYDLQDAPAGIENDPDWRSICLAWALPVAAEFAANDTSAEALADAVCQRFQDFLQDRETTRVQAAQKVVAARKYAAAQVEKIERLQSSIFFTRTFLVVGWLCFFVGVYFVSLTM